MQGLVPRMQRELRAVLVVALVSSLALPNSALAKMKPTTPKKAAKIERKFDLKDAKIPYSAGATAESIAPQDSVALTGDYRVDALLSGYAWSTGTVTYSFYSSPVFGGAYYGSETNVHEVSDAVKNNVRAVMAWYSTVMNLNLVEVTETASTVGQIRIMDSDSPSYAYAYYPGGTSMFSLAGDVHLNSSYDRLGDTNGFQNPAGQHGYLTLVHEIGHALGLKHSFDGSTVLPTAEDNTANTVMTYTFTGNSPCTPQVYDLRALQQIYGARAKNAGDDTYVFTSRGTSQYTVGGALQRETPYQTKQTIWDTGGVDTLDASGLPLATGGYRFDLNGGGWLTANGQYKTTYYDYGSSLAYTFAPENFVNSASSDTILANSSANVFKGYSASRVTGADVIYNASAADSVDLSDYTYAMVSRAQSGTDLVLGLGPNGSITIKEYYAGGAPQLLFAGSTPPPPNSAPVARISASGSTGEAPLAVTFDGTGSTDAEGAIASYAWEFGDGAVASGAVASHTFTGAGTYVVKLTVTDSEGATGSATYTVSVANAPAPATIKVHVASISLAKAPAKRGSLVRALVTLADENGRPVASAVVSGSFSGVVTGGVTGTTNSSGLATIDSGTIKKNGTVTFTVKGVTLPSGYSYDAAANQSNTASINVTR